MAAVRHLAGDRTAPGTSPAYHRAADWVERRLAALGWQVRRQPFRTPAGVSWGVPVPAGRSVNVVATRGDVRPGRPLARGRRPPRHGAAGARARRTTPPASACCWRSPRRSPEPGPGCRWCWSPSASEEPRGPADDDHHYGSRAYVAALGPAERRTLRGMVSLDRVGVGDVRAGRAARDGPGRGAARQLLAAARRAGVPTVAETGNRAQRPLVVRARGAARACGSAARRTPATTRAADVPSRRRPGPARAGGPDVVAWLARWLTRPSARRTARCWSTTRRRGSPRPPRRATGRGAKLAGSIRYGTSRTRPAGRPRTSPRGRRPPCVCSMKSMSKTKLPSECSTGTPPTASTPCTQCGWPPTTRSAPAATRSPADRRAGSARAGGCTASPQCGSTTTTSARRAVRRTTRGDPVEVGLHAAVRCAAASAPTARPGVPGSARGVSPIALKPTKPNRDAVRARATAGRAASAGRAGAERLDPAAARAVDGLEQRVARRSRRCGCWPATARRSPRRAAARAAPGCRRTSRHPGSARPGSTGCSPGCRR